MSLTSRSAAMNRYAMTAMTYFQEFLPTRYSQIEDPTSFFQDLGQQIQSQVVDLTPQIAGADPAGETYLEKVGRLNAAQRQAEEIVLKDLVYSQAPENEPEDLDEETAAHYGDLNQTLQDLSSLTTTLLDEPTSNAGNGSAGPEASSKNR
jgi:hypothetical protein